MKSAVELMVEILNEKFESRQIRSYMIKPNNKLEFKIFDSTGMRPLELIDWLVFTLCDKYDTDLKYLSVITKPSANYELIKIQAIPF